MVSFPMTIELFRDFDRSVATPQAHIFSLGILETFRRHFKEFILASFSLFSLIYPCEKLNKDFIMDQIFIDELSAA